MLQDQEMGEVQMLGRIREANHLWADVHERFGWSSEELDDMNVIVDYWQKVADANPVPPLTDTMLRALVKVKRREMEVHREKYSGT